MWWTVGLIAALAGGVWTGLGWPGLPGRQDQVLPPGRTRRRLPKNYIDWHKPKRRG